MKPRYAIGLVTVTVLAALAAAWLTPPEPAPVAPAFLFGAPDAIGGP